jgi:hypothetical protein
MLQNFAIWDLTWEARYLDAGYVEAVKFRNRMKIFQQGYLTDLVAFHNPIAKNYAPNSTAQPSSQLS